MKIYHSKRYLIKQLNRKDYIQIAKENNVDSSTIQRWMRKYGLTKGSISWTKEEIELLKKHYQINSNVYSLFPNRSISSINHKASRLDLNRLIRKRKYKINHCFYEIRGSDPL